MSRAIWGLRSDQIDEDVIVCGVGNGTNEAKKLKMMMNALDSRNE